MKEGYEQVLVEKGVDPNLLLAAMKNGGQGMDPATVLALANDKDDDYFKWIILLGILRGGFFGDEGKAAATGVLEGQLSGIRDSQQTNALAGRDGQTAILQAIQAAAAASAQCCCETKGQVAQSQSVTQADGSATRQAICNSQNDLQAQIAAAAARSAECCCETQRLVESTSCDTQRSIDKCCCDTQLGVKDSAQETRNFVLAETNRLQDNFNEQNLTLSRMAQQDALTNQELKNILNLGFSGASKELCEVENTIQRGFAQTSREICEQTQALTVQATANTQRIIDGQQRILDTMTENRIRELEAANTQLRTEAMLQQQTQQITQACGCCGGQVRCGHHWWGGGQGNGNGGPPGPP